MSESRKKRNLLEKQRHRLVWLVSVLLFASLFVRNFFQDKAKEEADAVANARNLFAVRMDALRAADQIIENIEPDSAAPRPLTPDELEGEVKKQLKVDFSTSIASLHMVDALGRLAKALDLSEEEKVTLQHIQERNEQRGDTFKRLGDSLQRHSLKGADLLTAKRIANDASALDWDVLDLGTSLSDEADREVARKESIYKWATNLLIVLGFCLWYLTVLSKRYGLDLPEGEA